MRGGAPPTDAAAAQRALSRGRRALARACARRPRRPAVAAAGDRPPRGAAPPRPPRSGSSPSCRSAATRARARARDADRARPAARGAVGAPDDGAVPVGPPGRRARRLPPRARGAGRGARASSPRPSCGGSSSRCSGRTRALEVAGRPLRGFRLLEQVGEGAFGVVHRAFQPQVGSRGRGQGRASRAGQRPGVHPPLRGRGAARRAPRAPAHRPALRLLARAGRRLPGHALHARRKPARRAGRAGRCPCRGGARVVDQVGARAGLGAPPGRRAPRRQAGEHPLRRGGQRLPVRLRHRRATSARARTPDRARGSYRLVDYLSPEELRGEAPTARADIYSLGLRPARDARRPPPAGRHAARGPAARPVPPREPMLAGPRRDRRCAARDDPTERYADAARSCRRSRHGRVRAGRRGTRWPGPQPVQGPAPVPGARRARLPRAARASSHGWSSASPATARRAGARWSDRRAAASPRRCALGWCRRCAPGAVPGSRALVRRRDRARRRAVRRARRSARRARSDWRPRPTWPGASSATPTALAEAAAWLLPDEDSELLLVIDQFEELFTLVEDEERRAAFLAALRCGERPAQPRAHRAHAARGLLRPAARPSRLRGGPARRHRARPAAERRRARARDRRAGRARGRRASRAGCSPSWSSTSPASPARCRCCSSRSPSCSTAATTGR